MYEVIKTIGGRRYRYMQETYRVNGKVKTRNLYLGPVDGERRRSLKGFIQDLVRKDAYSIEETEAQMRERVAGEERERAMVAHVNDLLAAPTISLAGIAEIAEAQSDVGVGADQSSEGSSDGPS